MKKHYYICKKHSMLGDVGTFDDRITFFLNEQTIKALIETGHIRVIEEKDIIEYIEYKKSYPL